MKLPIPQLVINEFEMAIDIGLTTITGVSDVQVTHAEFGLMLLERIGPFQSRAPHSADIVEKMMADCSCAALNVTVKGLDIAHDYLNNHVRTRIGLMLIADGLEGTLSQLLVEPILPFQVFPVGGADNLEERIHKATDGSAAYDIIAQEDIVVTGEAQMIKLGFKTRMDYRNCAMLLPRSGHGAKWGFTLVNTVGLIDSDYPGEWMAKIYLNDVPGVNDKKEPLLIPKGERLAQFLIVEPKQPEMVLVHDEAELRPTGRTGGFGSTNVHSQEQAG
ncbi:dUTP diphosphatase [Aeromonas sp. 23P]|uniref:dUTP diphosphatase n=1 Tax=Aeromonas sp. 23P TaxID=3452716 RepID=UPI003F7B3544